MYESWLKSFADVASLGLEAQVVIAQRLSMFALGSPNWHDEAQRMVMEKLYAAGEAAMMLTTGASNEAVIRIYRRTIQANAERLARA